MVERVWIRNETEKEQIFRARALQSARAVQITGDVSWEERVVAQVEV